MLEKVISSEFKFVARCDGECGDIEFGYEKDALKAHIKSIGWDIFPVPNGQGDIYYLALCPACQAERSRQ